MNHCRLRTTKTVPWKIRMNCFRSSFPFLPPSFRSFPPCLSICYQSSLSFCSVKYPCDLNKDRLHQKHQSKLQALNKQHFFMAEVLSTRPYGRRKGKASQTADRNEFKVQKRIVANLSTYICSNPLA